MFGAVLGGMVWEKLFLGIVLFVIDFAPIDLYQLWLQLSVI